MESEDEDAHVMPTEREHTCGADCWCEPEVVFVADNGNQVWLHKEVQ